MIDATMRRSRNGIARHGLADSRTNAMSDQRNLLATKQKLAEKYEHLAALAGSRPKRKQFSNRARKYRRQMEQISRNIES